jgi:hypothetical protein
MMIRTAGVVMVVLSFAGAAVAAPPAPPKQQPAKERRLHVAAAEASSYLINDWNKFQENYLPLYVGDDDPHTAWSLKTEGIGEWLRVHVTPMEGATKVRMKIRNGYQKTPRLFEANSRAKELTVVLLPSKKTVDVTLKDASDWQEIVIDQPAGALEAVEMKVKSVYPGKKYDDLCVSDVQLFVTATSSDNPAFEKQRLEKIATWKKERAAAAKLFKTKLGQSLPIAAQYTLTRPETPPQIDRDTCPRGGDFCFMSAAIARATKADAKGKHAAALATAADLVRTKFTTMTAVRVSAKDKRAFPTVDGLCAPSIDSCVQDACEDALPLPITGQMGYLETEALALIEQTGLPSFEDALARKPPQCNKQAPATFAWALRDPASSAPDAGVPRLRALLLVRCGMVEGREGPYPSSTSQLLVYGGDGRLEVVNGTSTAAVIDWNQGAGGAKLARASISGAYADNDMQIDAATAVATK